MGRRVPALVEWPDQQVLHDRYAPPSILELRKRRIFVRTTKTSPNYGRLPAPTAHHAQFRAAPRRPRGTRPERIPDFLSPDEPRAILLHDRLHGRALRVGRQVVSDRVFGDDVRVGGRVGVGQGRD